MRTIFKNLRIAALLLCVAMLVAGCSNVLDDGEKAVSAKTMRAEIPSEERTTSITVSVLGVPNAKKNYNVWAWSGADAYNSEGWPGNDMRMEKQNSSEGGFNDIFSRTFNVDPEKPLSIIFVDADKSPQTKDISVDKGYLVEGAKLYFLWNNTKVYANIQTVPPITSASVSDADGSKISISILTTIIDKNGLSVTDRNGDKLSVTNVSEVKDGMAVVTVSDGALEKIPYTICYKENKTVASLALDVVENFADAAKNVQGLGLTLSGNTATFKTWAPTASNVELLLLPTAKDALTATTAIPVSFAGTNTKMTLDPTTGVWSAENVNFGSNKYYQYRITNDAVTYNVSDIWHTVAGPDSVASQIASIDDEAAKPAGWEASYTNPFGKSGAETKSYSDAVIYEMHIRDWTRAVVLGSTGKFLDIANSETIISHLKDIGVTHVQILPMFDYAQTNADPNYNWGYNPYHYNVPEGRYVTEGYTDGTQAVKEMRTMIQKLHEANIAVIMDVVYNHTNGTGTGSLYDMTVPKYFYRDKDYTGCGNAVSTDHRMVRKYVIESLKHWMNDYHINGFRFDLMGVHEQEMMKEVYKELSAIDKNVMVYGEPWTADGYPDDGCEGAVDVTDANGSNGVGAFDDDFRDAIKGAEYGGFWEGQVQGSYNDDGIVNGLLGKSGKNSRNTTGLPKLALHYAECHDNYTLFDKLAYSSLGDSSIRGKNDIVSKFPSADEIAKKIEDIKKQDKLAAAYLLLAQGTPFINGGQEFLRTKKGNPDSYAADTKGGVKWTNDAGVYNIDDCNTIDLEFKSTYNDVYNTYKGLIALRKANPMAFGSNISAKAEKIETGVTKYVTGDFTVVFNATDSDFYLPANKAGVMSFVHHSSIVKVIDVSSGEPKEVISIPPTSVPAKSFVILKK